MSLAMPGNDGTRCLSTGSSFTSKPLGRDRRVDHDDAGDPVGVVLGEPQHQRAAHREPADDDGVVLGDELVEGAA